MVTFFLRKSDFLKTLLRREDVLIPETSTGHADETVSNVLMQWENLVKRDCRGKQ